MKKLILPLLFGALIASPSLAGAEVSPYVSLSGGVGIAHSSDIKLNSGYTFLSGDGEVKYDAGYAIEGAVGASMDSFRAEFALGYQENSIDSISNNTANNSDLSVLSYMVNCYADLAKENEISPYIMAGLGGATVDAKYETLSDNSSVFAWQIGVGASYAASENVTFDLGYRYFATAGVDLSEYGAAYDEVSFSTSRVLVGLRYGF